MEQQDLPNDHLAEIPNQGFGVNVCGYLRTESGVGAATRGYVRALRCSDIPIAFQDLSHLCINRAEDHSLAVVESCCRYDLNLVCVDIEQHYAALSQIGEDRFDACYNIGVWWWELMQFPEKWRDRFAYYDEIWVGTSFIANSLAPVSPIPVVRIPPVLEPTTLGSRGAGRRHLGVSDLDFVFLFIFDLNSSHKRKNPLALIEAFKQAFTPFDPVRLVIKCVNERTNAAAYSDLLSQIKEYPILIRTGFWTTAEMQDLIAACDAYVSLHRAEGAGLSIADAMGHGKPAIATGWSGNMDFMNISNSFPIRYELVELEENAGHYRVGEIWADPSIDHAAELMRHVYLNPEEARARGLSAKQTIENDFSAHNVGRVISQRLDAIAMRRRFSSFREETKAAFIRYRGLGDYVRELASRLLPPGTTVIVVSKGDNDLVRLKGLRGWHFPQVEGGGYAGSYPPNSAAAIAHLEDLRERGGEFLLLPSSAFWWLDHYPEFKQHLGCYRVVVQNEHCMILYLGDINTASQESC